MSLYRYSSHYTNKKYKCDRVYNFDVMKCQGHCV